MKPRVLGQIGVRLVAPIVILAALLVVVLAGWLYREAQIGGHETIDRYSKLVGEMVLSHLREAMQTKDRPRIQRQLGHIARLNGVRNVLIVNKQGKVIFSADEALLGRVFPRSDPSCTVCHRPDVAPLHGQKTLLERSGTHSIIRAVQPILVEGECRRCHEQPTGAMLGSVVTDLDHDALAGSMEGRLARPVWFAGGIALLAVIVLTLAVRRLVVIRVRHLRRLVDGLRAGARALELVGSSRDEIDDLARSVQAFAVDLDQQVAVREAAGFVLSMLEHHPGPALLLDAAGRILVSNRAAVARLGVGAGQNLPGSERASLPEGPGSLLAEARDVGWALDASDARGAVIIALPGTATEGGVFLEAWADEAAGDEENTTGAAAVSPFAAADLDWWLYCAVLVEQLQPLKPWRGVASFDRRLSLGRRLANDLARSASTMRKHAPVELRPLVLVALDAARRDLRLPERRVEHHTVFSGTAQVLGARYQLYALLSRLIRTAAAQTPDHGEIVCFVRGDEGRSDLFVGVWSSASGAAGKLDGPGPGITQVIAQGHGGGVEVDPDFDLRPFADVHGLRLRSQATGTLFLARLPASPLAPI